MGTAVGFCIGFIVCLSVGRIANAIVGNDFQRKMIHHYEEIEHQWERIADALEDKEYTVYFDDTTGSETWSSKG